MLCIHSPSNTNNTNAVIAFSWKFFFCISVYGIRFSEGSGAILHITTMPAKIMKKCISPYNQKFFDKKIIVLIVRKVWSIHPSVVFLCIPPTNGRSDMMVARIKNASQNNRKPTKNNSTNRSFSISVSNTCILYPIRIRCSLFDSRVSQLSTFSVSFLFTSSKMAIPLTPISLLTRLLYFCDFTLAIDFSRSSINDTK